MSETAQKAEVATRQVNTSLWSLSVTCALAWMIPGLGHLLLRRSKQGIIFMVCILSLFFWGLSLGARLYQYEAHQPLTFFALIAQMGMGIPYFVARFMGFYGQTHVESFFHGFAESFQFGSGYVERFTYEYGNTFTIVAGLLNFLVILDAYDIAVGRKKG